VPASAPHHRYCGAEIPNLDGIVTNLFPSFHLDRLSLMPESPKQFTFFPESEALTLPSPKQRFQGTMAVRPWGAFLAAYSQAFAEAAIKLLDLPKAAVLFDPFVGSGTTLVAAARCGIRAIGNDLDPVSALLSRARVSSEFSERKIRALLDPAGSPQDKFIAKVAYDYFSPDDLSYSSKVFHRVSQKLKPGTKSPLKALLDDKKGVFDSEVVAIATLVAAANKSARSIRGSNPVWHRKAIQGERVKTAPLERAVEELLPHIFEDLEWLRSLPAKRKITTMCGDARMPLLASATVDAVLTSPPYLNRLDYVVNHLPQLYLLSAIETLDLNQLRRSMTGTTKIISKDETTEAFGPQCADVLRRIKEHKSYASDRYYQHVYRQYFSDIFTVFRQLRRQCRIGATGLMVVQTSYYKDILVDTPAIFTEMAEIAGFRAISFRTENVSVHYGNLSPRQLKYVPKKRLQESVLKLQF